MERTRGDWRQTEADGNNLHLKWCIDYTSAYSYQSSFKQIFTSIFFLKTSLKPSVYVSNLNWIRTVNYLFSKGNLFSELKRNCSLLLKYISSKYSLGFDIKFLNYRYPKAVGRDSTSLNNFILYFLSLYQGRSTRQTW